MSVLKNFKRILVIVMLLVAGSVSPLIEAETAQAATVHGCPEVRICLYNRTGFNSSSGVWSTAPVVLVRQPGRCISLRHRNYINTNISAYDSASSIVVNQVTFDPNDRLIFYNWINCNPGGGSVKFAPTGTWTFANLANFFGRNYNDTIASIEWVNS